MMRMMTMTMMVMVKFMKLMLIMTMLMVISFSFFFTSPLSPPHHSPPNPPSVHLPKTSSGTCSNLSEIRTDILMTHKRTAVRKRYSGVGHWREITSVEMLTRTLAKEKVQIITSGHTVRWLSALLACCSPPPGNKMLPYYWNFWPQNLQPEPKFQDFGKNAK